MTNKLILLFIFVFSLFNGALACDTIRVQKDITIFEELVYKRKELLTVSDSQSLEQLHSSVIPCIPALEGDLQNKAKQLQLDFVLRFRDYEESRSICERFVSDTLLVSYLLKKDQLTTLGNWVLEESSKSLATQLILTIESLLEDDKSNNLEVLMTNYYVIAHLQGRMGDFTSARLNYYKSAALIRQMENYPKPEKEVTMYESIAFGYYLEKQYDSSAIMLEKSSKILDFMLSELDSKADSLRYLKISNMRNKVQGQFAMIKLKLQEYEGLVPIFRASLSIDVNRKNKHFEKITLLNMAEAFNGINEADSSLLYLDYFMNKKKHCAKCRKRFYDIQSKVYMKQGNLEEAKSSFKEYMILSDSIQKGLKGNEDYQVIVNRRIDFINHLTDLYETEKRSHLLAKGVVVLLVLLLLILIYFIIKLRKRNKNIFRQKNYINKALREKTFLLQEVHHRVNNNLQLMSSIFYLDSLKYEDSVISEFLNTNQSKIFVLSLAHSMLGDNNEISRVAVDIYLEKLLEYFERSVGIDLEYSVEASDSFLIDDITTLGLYINELLYMSLSHMYSSERVRVKIKVEKEEGGQNYILEYSDDYFHQPFDVKGGLIKLLNEAIQGELLNNEVNENGRICRLRLKNGDNLNLS